MNTKAEWLPILQNIFFCVLQKCHIFGVDYPWKHSTRCSVKCLYISYFWKQKLTIVLHSFVGSQWSQIQNN